MEFISDFAAKVIGPGLIAALVSAIISSRFERLKATRDYITKLSDSLRDDVRKAVEAGVAYIGADEKGEREKAEANVQMYESEIRSAVTALKESCILADAGAWENVDAALGSFIDTLTGGEFGSLDPKHEAGLAKKIVGTGSALKMEITRVRRRQLQHSSWRNFDLPRATGTLILQVMFAGICVGCGAYLALIIVVG